MPRQPRIGPLHLCGQKAAAKFTKAANALNFFKGLKSENQIIAKVDVLLIKYFLKQYLALQSTCSTFVPYKAQ
jgi:hypothetical protein